MEVLGRFVLFPGFFREGVLQVGFVEMTKTNEIPITFM